MRIDELGVEEIEVDGRDIVVDEVEMRRRTRVVFVFEERLWRRLWKLRDWWGCAAVYMMVFSKGLLELVDGRAM
jgi:hypothetical protein